MKAQNPVVSKPRPYQLRDYQQQAVDATVRYFKSYDAAGVIVLPTGAGKSLVIAELAALAKKRVLVLAHVKELVQQNHSKYQSYGLQADIFSAGLLSKQARTQVVFGSVQSVAKNLESFADTFSLLIIDECHRVSSDENSEYQKLIQHLKSYNPALKVLGLTATPFRMGMGWIYELNLHKRCVAGDQTPLLEKSSTLSRPFYACIFELPLRYMIDHQFLTPVEVWDAPVMLYDFEQLRTSRQNVLTYTEDELNRVVFGAKRATATIIKQVLTLSEERQGVMLFAATVAHAKEVLSYLPTECSAIILGDMKAKARDSVIHAFKAQGIKYLVNVSVLTTGFDAPHVDLIVMMRPTESVGLYQQIVGRGLRLSPGKENCLVLDYAGNTHNLFAPQIAEPRPHSESDIVEVTCPSCQFINPFWGKIGTDGEIIEHYGRRCKGLVPAVETEHQAEKGHPQKLDSLVQCDFRFRFKVCESCGAENDIAARQCHSCESIIVDPDEKLKQALRLRDVKVLRCSGMSFSAIQIKAGGEALRVTYHDEDGEELAEVWRFDNPAQRAAFGHHFSRVHLMNPDIDSVPSSVSAALAIQQYFRAPDFVIARQDKRFWKVREKIFDYEGRYRKAHEMR